MNRKNDINTILIAATEQYSSVRKDYEKALQDKSLDIRVPVKNIMENLRSALDYMAHDIYELCCQSTRLNGGQPDPRNIYFPYGKTEDDFQSKVGSFLPGLDSLRPDIYKLIISIQPFIGGDTWLYDLCTILNEKKHNRLKAQERIESETYTVESQNGSVTIPVNNPNSKVTSIPGTVEIFGVPAEFHENGIHTAPSDKLKHTRTKWVAFTFAGTNVNVIGLLDKAIMGVKTITKEIYQKI